MIQRSMVFSWHVPNTLTSLSSEQAKQIVPEGSHSAQPGLQLFAAAKLANRRISMKIFSVLFIR